MSLTNFNLILVLYQYMARGLGHLRITKVTNNHLLVKLTIIPHKPLINKKLSESSSKCIEIKFLNWKIHEFKL